MRVDENGSTGQAQRTIDPEKKRKAAAIQQAQGTRDPLDFPELDHMVATMPARIITPCDPNRVWPRFRSGEKQRWADPVTRDIVTLDSDGEIFLKGSSLGYGHDIADVAAKLGIRLEGVNDEPPGEIKPETLLCQGKHVETARKLVESPEASAAEIPLAVGQRWRDEREKVEIIGINRDEIRYRHDEGTTGRLFEKTFRDAYPIPFSPAPEPEPQSPSRDDLIAALTSGKRLRFERDPTSKCRGPWEGIRLTLEQRGGYWRSVFYSPANPTFELQTLGYSDSSRGAGAGVNHAISFGYRFAEVLD